MTPQQTKDLLIHAAKAAGLEGYRFQEENPLSYAMMVRRNIDEHGWDIGVQEFDPINCDGDAFGLMVKCRLVVTIGANNVEARRWSAGDMLPLYGRIEPQNGNPYAATRLAITKAAAMTEGWKE